MSSATDYITAMAAVQHDDFVALVDKCQENCWLKLGGYVWQYDPYLEEYPYSFSNIEDCESLRQFFLSGNWSIRTGVVFDGLAFIQQVDGGDEWWILKKTGDTYMGFESISFEDIAQYPAEFNRKIYSMLTATHKQCADLEYSLPDYGIHNLTWTHHRSRNNLNNSYQIVDCQEFRATVEGKYEINIYERPSFPGYAITIYSIRGKCLLMHQEDYNNAHDAIKVAEQDIAHYIKHDISSVQDRNQANSLYSRITNLRESANALIAGHKTKPLQAKGP